MAALVQEFFCFLPNDLIHSKMKMSIETIMLLFKIMIIIGRFLVTR